MNRSKSKPKTVKQTITQFAVGSVLGTFMAILFWSCSVYFHVHLDPDITIIGISIVAISCGAIASVSSIEELMDLMDNFPPI